MPSFLDSNDPVTFAQRELGFEPSLAQAALLATVHRYVLLNCHRQWGKSTLAALRALYRAVMFRNQVIVILSPTLRQSGLLAARCRALAERLGMDLRTDGENPRSIVFPNGSVILPVPAIAERVRGYTANLLIIDEAALVKDEVYAAATPMLAATNGELWLLSTPHGKRGFFYDEWISTDSATHPWLRVSGTVGSGSHISAGFLATEKRKKTAEQYAAEFECSFETDGRNVFTEKVLEESFTADVAPFDFCSREDLQFIRHGPSYYLALDIASKSDYAAMILLEYRPTYSGLRDRATYEALYRRDLRVVHIERFRKGTEYKELVARVSQFCRHPHLEYRTQLILDATGQGIPVVELFQDARLPVSLLPVSITGGKEMTVKGSWRYVPKADLIGALEVLFERKHLRIAADLPQADLLREELRRFERTSSRGGHVKYGAGQGHDDLVMALALAGWWAWKNRRHLLSGGELKALG